MRQDSAGNSTIANTDNITSARGRSISGQATSAITALTSAVNPRRTVTGVIEGSTDGIRLGFIESLTNHAVAMIEGKGDAGVVLTRTSGETATVTNSKNTSLRSLRAGSLLNLDNRSAIISEQASAIQLTGTASRAATIANSGTIQGAASGLDYGTNAISSLTNTGRIQGGSGPALRAGPSAR